MADAFGSTRRRKMIEIISQRIKEKLTNDIGKGKLTDE
jgi:hypothetical protein